MLRSVGELVTLETGVMKHDELLLPKGVCCLPYWMPSKKIEKKGGGESGDFDRFLS